MARVWTGTDMLGDLCGIACSHAGFFRLERSAERFSVSSVGVAREDYVWKSAGGVDRYFIAVAVPLSFMALYFASVGLEYIPVDPIQILPTSLLCIACFAMHPAALLTIDREASWFGTRLLPLPIAIISLVMLTAFTLSATSSLMQVVVLLLFLVVLSFLLLGLQRGHFARKIILAAGAVSTVIIAIFFGASLVQSLTVQAQYHTIEYGIDNQGDLWVYKSRFDYSENGYVSIRVPISGYRFQSEGEPNIKGTLPENFEPYALTWLCRLADSPRQHRYQYSGYTGRKYLVSAPNGIVLVYDWNSTPPLQGAISRSGFHASVDAVGEPFEGDALIAGSTASTPLVAAGYEPLWIDRAGVYQFDRDRGLITTLVELPIESASVMIAEDKNATEKKVVRLFVQTDTDAHVFTLIDSAGATNWFSDDSGSRSRALPQLQAAKERTVPKLPSLPSELGGRVPMIGSTVDGGLVAVSVYGNYRRAVLANEPNATWELDQIVPPTESVDAVPRAGTVCLISLIPPGVLLILGISALVISAVNNLPSPTMLGLPNESLLVAVLVGVTATLGSVALVWGAWSSTRV